ncbi:MAG: hypothetical protein JSV03_11280, partial [Planctomycetota bacterium]
MKSQTPIIATVAAVVVGLIVIFAITPRLQSPQARLNRQIDDQIDLAMRIIAGYKPDGMHLASHLDSAATQPADIPPNMWQENISYVQQESPFADSIRKINNELRRLDQLTSNLRDETLHPTAADSARDGYQELNQELKRNESSIADALATVSKAVRMSIEAGDETIRGSSHPIATRMEAVLCYNQADLLRRRASIYHALADVDRARFLRILSSWRHINAAVLSLERDINPSQPETEAEASTNAVKQSDKEKTTPEKVAAKPQKIKKQTGGPSPFTTGLRKLFDKETKPADEPTDTAVQQQPPVPEEQPPAAEESPEESESVELPKIVYEKLPTIQQRITKLQNRQEQVASDIDSAKEKAKKLTATIKDLEWRIADAKSKASKAEEKMLALKSAGIDPADPESLKQFTNDYNTAAQIHRNASSEATILEKGSIRNARPESEDQDKKQSVPLVPVDPQKEMTEVRGLIALQSDLRIAEGNIETNTALLKEIDKQIEDLTIHQEDTKQRLARMKTSRDDLLKQAEKVLTSAIDAVAQADKLENEALALIENTGKPAAERAQRAADKRLSDARNLRDPKSEDPRINMIIGDRFIGGHVKSL